MKAYKTNSNPVQAIKGTMPKRQRKAYAKARQQRKQARGKQWHYSQI